MVAFRSVSDRLFALQGLSAQRFGAILQVKTDHNLEGSQQTSEAVVQRHVEELLHFQQHLPPLVLSDRADQEDG